MSKRTPSALTKSVLTRACLALGFLALTNCGSKSAGVCDGDTAAADCGQPCESPTECSDGTYCDANHVCSSECTPGSDECGEGLICTDDGRCQDPTCASIELQVNSITPSIELVIDRSGSMKWDFSGANQNPPAGESRWDAIKAALVGADGVITELSNRIYFGASLYYYQVNTDQCLYTLDSARDMNNAEALTSLIQNTAPSGGTPTSLAVNHAVERFASTPAPADSPKYILLVTDGEPTLPCTANTQETNGSLTVAAIQAAKQADITTLVLGVSTQVAAANLQRFANAGQGLDPDGATKADYAVATSSADLIADLTALLGSARSCDLLLQGSIDPSAASSGTVTLNGNPLTYSTDWMVVDDTTLRLNGAACDTFLASPTAAVAANFPCDAVVTVF